MALGYRFLRTEGAGLSRPNRSPSVSTPVSLAPTPRYPRRDKNLVPTLNRVVADVGLSLDVFVY
jgi:hypothetical protein